MEKIMVGKASLLLCGTGLTVAVLGAGPAMAQTAPDREEIAGEQAGVIVVTAQKREQNVQDVPLSVQVIDQSQLDAHAVVEFQDLNRIAPSLTIRPTENPQSANIQIRGIGTLAFSPSVEPSVAIVMDDVPLAFQSRAFSDLSNVERIEVLRGPQSTLYGKSASAGLINIVTKAPSRDPEFSLRGMVTTDDEQQIGATISGPITDTLGVRSTVNYNHFDGNTRNLNDGELINGREYFSSRNRIRWEPTDSLQIDASIDYSQGRTSSTRPFIELGDGAILRGNPAFTAAVFAPGIEVDGDNTDVAIDFISGNTFDDFAQSLRVTYDTGGPSLMSITAHDRYSSLDEFDSDDAAIPTYRNVQYGNFDAEQFSQEFRLVSPGADRFRYTLGLFFNDLEVDRDFFRGPLFSAANWDANTGSQQIAAFGQLEYDVLDGTTLIGGARYSRERIDYTYDDLRTGQSFAGDSTDWFGTWKLGIQQDLNPDVMVFATFATGHKGEAYDISTGFNRARADAGPVRPETADDYQIGLRSQFLGNDVVLNVTLFNTEYENFQTQAIEDIEGVLNFRLTNVGGLRTRGVEVETVIRPVADLTLTGAGSYVDAKITSYPGAPCYMGQTVAQGCTGTPASQDLTGVQLLQAPEWKLTGSLDYSPQIGNGPLALVSQVAVNWQTKIVPIDQNPRTVQPGYAMVNLGLGLEDTDGGWQVVAFVNNLFNQHYRYLINDVSSRYGTTAIQGYVPRDFYRHGGVRATYAF
ncbi:TonB-dependent receptor [Croceibacterium sp. TMG7-5b_MA50]|uniref:TonB-dependent receptor n=1 Tax=Croceibacterium sp. TMG7-5b_MA50 TaxID=3121290 RepID=UPI00322177D1